MPVSAFLDSFGAIAGGEVIAYGPANRPQAAVTSQATGPAAAATQLDFTAIHGPNVTFTYLSVVEAYLQGVNCPRTVRYPLTGQRGHYAFEPA